MSFSSPLAPSLLCRFPSFASPLYSSVFLTRFQLAGHRTQSIGINHKAWTSTFQKFRMVNRTNRKIRNKWYENGAEQFGLLPQFSEDIKLIKQRVLFVSYALISPMTMPLKCVCVCLYAILLYIVFI